MRFELLLKEVKSVQIMSQWYAEKGGKKDDMLKKEGKDDMLLC